MHVLCLRWYVGMTVHALASRQIPGVAGHLPRLVASTVPVGSLDRATISDAFTLFSTAYEGTDRARFERDLAEKQLIILLHDSATRALKGFSTVLIQPTTVGPAGTVVFSGDTVIDREYWGQKALQTAFSRILLSLKVRSPRRPVFWFLISKGYRTYLLLANAFPCAVPRHDRDDDRQLAALLDVLARGRYGSQYDARTRVIHLAASHERVREGTAPVTEALLHNPHVQFFVDRNPGHVDGDELACLADVRLRDLARVILRIALARAGRAFGRSGSRS